MVKKQPLRTKHIPQRTCVGCRQVLAKRSLTRVVKTDTGIRIDSSGKMPGRGAYIHEQLSCWQSALRGRLANALRIELTENDHFILKEYMERLAVSSPQDDQAESNS